MAIRGSLRVPRRPLETMAGGPITTTAVDEKPNGDGRHTASRERTAKPKRTNSRDSQRSLFTD